MFASSKVLTALSFLAIASASPAARAPTCMPNFQGSAMTAYVQPSVTDIGVFEWRPVNAENGHISLVQTPVNDAFAQGEFLIEFTGQPENTHHIKQVADTERKLALGGKADGDLSFAVANSDGSQDFAISCESCPTNDDLSASKCVVKHPATGKCVSGANPGNTLSLAACDGSDAQVYYFRASV